MKRKPVGVITPEGGEPMYIEEDTGLWLTANDFTARNDCTKEELEDALNDRRPASSYYE